MEKVIVGSCTHQHVKEASPAHDDGADEDKISQDWLPEREESNGVDSEIKTSSEKGRYEKYPMKICRLDRCVALHVDVSSDGLQ